MDSGHHAYWEAAERGELTPEALRHENQCRTCADMRWALEELRWDVETAVPPVPPHLVEEIRRHLAETSPAWSTGSGTDSPSPPPAARAPGPRLRGPRRKTTVRALVAVTATLATAVAVLTVALGPTKRPAHADVTLPDTCTAALREQVSNNVVVAGVWAGEERRRFRLVLDRFEADTGIKVVFASRDPDADRDLGSTLRALDDGGCAPGVALLPQPGLVKDLAAEHRLRPVESFARDMVDQHYRLLWRQLGTGDDGQLYGVWFKASNKSMIWYNTRTFERAGVAPPADWEGLKSVARALRANGITPFSVAAGTTAAWTLTDWFENIYLQTAGPDRYDQLARHEIPWNHPTVATALEVMADVLRPEWVLPDAAETTYEESVQGVFAHLDHPAAAMVFEADFVANEMAKTAAKIGVDASMFPFPSISGRTPTVVGGAEQAASGEVGGDVAVVMHETPQARALLRFLASPDAAVPWARLGGFLSPNRNFPESAYPDAPTGAAAKALADAPTVRFDLSDLQHTEFGSTPGQGMWSLLRDLVVNRPAPEATADRLEEAYCRTVPAARACP